MIFIQIAAYRDPELLPTIIDCLAKAKYKKDLIFGVCWQSCQSDRCLDSLMSLPNFRVDKVPWEESQGLGWARSRIQSLYEGEDYTLQLHSHHRFALDWDETLMKAMELTGSPKPVLSSYGAAYDPNTNRKIEGGPCMIAADRFAECGNVLFRPLPIPESDNLTRPMRARFASGHFLFTLGSHCEDCRYDPELYFAGDEISLSIRSFTLGYDLFHPHTNVVWHEYVRAGRTKHWDDHTTENLDKVNMAWHDRNAVSKRRLRKLLKQEENDEDPGRYGLGNARSHRDYEIYAGIDFRNRRLQCDSVRGVNLAHRLKLE